MLMLLMRIRLPAAVRLGTVSIGTARALDVAACALDVAYCFSFFASRTFVHAHASALSASLFKTKSRADPTGFPVVATAGTAVAPSTADDGSAHVPTDCDCVIAVALAVREGHTYNAYGGVGAII
jgi:hypothetical protein